MRIEINNVKLVKESGLNYQKDFNITSPRSVYEFIEEVYSLSEEAVENLVIVAVNTKHKVISSMLSRGTVNASLVSPREVFQWALLNNATSIIIAHNHPSGDTRPSNEDIEITKRISEAGKLLGVNVLDHLIIGDSYKSLKEDGYL